MKLVSLLLTLTLALLSPSTATAALQAEGLHAPAGTWHIAGGSAAHNGSTLTDLSELEPELRWTSKGKGAIVSEPLVWNRRVFVERKISDSQRSLEIVDLISGKTVSTKTFKTSEPLATSIWGDLLALRAGPQTVSFYQLNGNRKPRFTRIGTFEHDSAVGNPLLFGTEAYVPTATGLFRIKPRSAKIVWVSKGKFTGVASIMGELVFALRYTDANASVAAFERGTGKTSASAGAGNHGGLEPGTASSAYIALAPKEARLHCALPVSLADSQTANALAFKLNKSGPQEVSGTFSHDHKEALTDEGWLTFEQPAQDRLLILEHLGTGQSSLQARLLAFKDVHPNVASNSMDVSRAGSTYLIGGIGVDASDLTIRWSVAGTLRTRTIPATDCILMKTAEDEITAFGKPARLSEPLTFLPGDLPKADDGGFSIGRISGIDMDGAAFDGKHLLAETRDAFYVDRRRKSTELPFTELTYAEDATGRPLVMSGIEGLVAGVTFLFDTDQREAYLDLAYDARKAKDPALLQRLFSAALALGAEGKQVEEIEKVLSGFAKSPPKKPVAKRVTDIEAREVELANASFAELLSERIDALGDAPDPGVHLEMLSAILHEDPQHEAALGQLAKLVEQRFDEVQIPSDGRFADALEGTRQNKPGSPSPSDWSSFVDISGRMQLTFVEPVPDGKGLTNEQLILGMATTRWRKDLFLLSSPRLQVITPIANPGQIAHCIRLGELVCDMLEAEFEPYAKSTGDARPMTLYLYENQTEYLAKSLGSRGAMGPNQTWMAGHYSPSENLQHIFLPDNEDAFEHVRSVFVHELTHNWLSRRCPLYTNSEIARNPNLEGFWIVEGIASFFQEALIDVKTGEYELVNPRAASLDTMSNATTRHGWDYLFKLNQYTFGKLDTKKTIPCQLSWRLGAQNPLTAKSLFYEQATATARYLYLANDGEHRAELFAFIRSYYTGEEDKTNIALNLKLHPLKLGKSIRDFARASMRK